MKSASDAGTGPPASLRASARTNRRRNTRGDVDKPEVSQIDLVVDERLEANANGSDQRQSDATPLRRDNGTITCQQQRVADCSGCSSGGDTVRPEPVPASLEPDGTARKSQANVSQPSRVADNCSAKSRAAPAQGSRASRSARLLGGEARESVGMIAPVSPRGLLGVEAKDSASIVRLLSPRGLTARSRRDACHLRPRQGYHKEREGASHRVPKLPSLQVQAASPQKQHQQQCDQQQDHHQLQPQPQPQLPPPPPPPPQQQQPSPQEEQSNWDCRLVSIGSGSMVKSMLIESMFKALS